ncbi:MAG TPA: ribonuclease HII [bacterium]|nr:ribonuclease HII [bacterium]
MSSAPRDLYRRERALARKHGGPVAGLDEVGRGPLAGPVVAAAVVLPPRGRIAGIGDSKTLDPDERERLFGEIREHALAVGVGWATSGEVDRRNILRASHLAMARAAARLRLSPAHLLVDGLPVEGLPMEHTAIVKGDGKCACIAAASIVAKVLRDRLMRRIAGRFPQYGFDRNMGYPTPEHREALARTGPCLHHRLTFFPVREALQLELGWSA